MLTRIFTQANIAVGGAVRGLEVKPKPDEDEAALFREAVRGVKPLTAAQRVAAAAPKPRARARFTRADRQAVLEEILHGSPDEPELDAADPSLFVRPGVAATTLRKLRRGLFPVEAELDLHGLTQSRGTRPARAVPPRRPRRRLAMRANHSWQGISIGCAGSGAQDGCRLVASAAYGRLAFTSARPIDGGTGAVYVLLAGGP